MDAVRELFREYAKWVGSPICFASFERELSELPGRYSPLLVAEPTFRAATARERLPVPLAGCAALRKLSDTIGEIKRLYVRPAYQGTGLGRQLIEQVVAEAKAAGYHQLRLDTLPIMERAISLYRQFGFHEIPRYGDNPEEAICFELRLHCQ